MKKIINLILLVLTLIFSTSFSSFASNDKTLAIEVNENTTVYATIPAQYVSEISETELKEIAIADNLANGERIIIEEIGVVEQDNESVETVQPCLDWTVTIETEKELISKNHVMKDDFIISVAKGETATLTKTYNGSVSQSISGSYYSLDAELKGTVSCTYSMTKVWNGPSESSSYNSREFRVKYLGDKYSYTQKRCLDGYVSGTKSGTVTIPTKYASYSIDSNQ